ncbi:MAG: extracellular solute-binding protein [Clostridia bacterium]|nr:extracellular solute-binding protein [Clostridia bacterium]
MKRFLSLALLCLTLLTLVSCHGAREKKSFEIPEELDTSRNYEISFWAKNDTNMTQVGIYKDAIAEFESLYPNIKVNLKLYTDYGKIYNDVITNISTDTTPNVCITYPDHIATYLTGEDTVLALDELFSHKKYGLGGSEVRFDSPTFDELIPKFIGECEFNGSYYAVPFMRSTEACYVNRTFVEKLGFTLPETLTWDFIWKVSEKAMEQDADGNFIVNGQKTMIPIIYKSTDNMMIHAMYQQDAGYSTPHGEIELFNDEAKEFLLEISKHSGTRAFNTFKRAGYPANFLNAGQCIFAIDSTAGATWMGSDAPLVDIAEEKLVRFDTEVMTVPQHDPSNPRMISQGPSMCVFNKEDEQEVLASWLFCQFMLTNEVQIAYSQTEGYAPVTTKAQNSEEYRDYLSREGEDNEFYYDIKLRAVKLLLDNTENTFVTPVFNGSASLRNAAGELIENVNKTARRGDTVDSEYIDSLYDEVISLYRLDQISASKGKLTLGELPTGSRVLLTSLALIWLSMAIYVTFSAKKRKNK